MKKRIVLAAVLAAMLASGCGVGVGSYHRKTADSETNYWGLMGPVIPAERSAVSAVSIPAASVYAVPVYSYPRPVWRLPYRLRRW